MAPPDRLRHSPAALGWNSGLGRTAPGRAPLRPAAQPLHGGPDTPGPAPGRSPAPPRCPPARPALPAAAPGRVAPRREGEHGKLRSDPAPSAPPAAPFNNGPRSGTGPAAGNGPAFSGLPFSPGTASRTPAAAGV